MNPYDDGVTVANKALNARRVDVARLAYWAEEAADIAFKSGYHEAYERCRGFLDTLREHQAERSDI